VVFQANFDKIELQKINYDVILVTYRHYITEKRHQNNFTIFFYFVPPPIKISSYA